MSRDQENEFRSALTSEVESFGLSPLTSQQESRLVSHYTMLCRWNARTNLTRIIAPREAAGLHYSESLFGAGFIGPARTVLDVGSGAGFPAIPLAVAMPDVQVTALESDHKKALFLKEAKDALNLENFKVVRARLEEFDWAAYDLLTSRAVERAEAIFSSVINSLCASRRLMLYCTSELVARLKEQVSGCCVIEAHPIPQSERRVIAIFASHPATSRADSTD